MFEYDRYAPQRIKAHIYYRAMVLYPQRRQLPCSIKDCANKKKNGRCGLQECRLELDEHEKLTGVCLCFKERGKDKAF